MDMTPETLSQKGEAVTSDYNVFTTPYGTFLYNSHEYAPPWGNGLTTGYAYELDFLGQFARGVCVDVGANIGTHSVLYSRTAEQVYAFEPQQLIYYNLCANLLLNHVTNVEPFHLALGPRQGVVNVTAMDPRQLHASAGGRVGMGEARVGMITLDSLELPRCHYIKIDVEGYETEVLVGCHETLARCRPIVYVEVHANELEPIIEEWMSARGYKGSIAATIQLLDPFTKGLTDILLHSWLYLPNELEAVIP